MNGSYSSKISGMDRKLAFSFGAVILVLMLTAAGVASYLFGHLNSLVEDRLAATIALILDQSISKVSFSGKYHTRLLVEEMAGKVQELDFISVETKEGRVVAHSDPSKNDTFMSATEENANLRLESLRRLGPVVGDETHEGHKVKVVVIPYRGGSDSSVLGVVRIGINAEEFRKEQSHNLLMLLFLVALLTGVAIWTVMILSRHFGGKVRTFAIRLKEMADSVPGVIYQFEISRDDTIRVSFVSQSAERIFGIKTFPPESFISEVHAECRKKSFKLGI